MARIDGKTPGDAMTSPFGDGDGATTMKGPSTGGGRDFTAESRPQPVGACPPNPQSIPAGGKLPFSSPPKTLGQAAKPFKLAGEAPAGDMPTDEEPEAY